MLTPGATGMPMVEVHAAAALGTWRGGRIGGRSVRKLFVRVIRSGLAGEAGWSGR